MAFNSSNYEFYAARLADSAVGNDVKVAIAIELRDSIEIVHSLEYQPFLARILPTFKLLLEQVPPQDFGENNEHKLRNMILEIILRFPQNEALKPYAHDLMVLLMDVLANDNEENAVICLKIIVDLHKHYTSIMQDQVQSFLHIVKEMYSNMEYAVQQTFDDQDQQMQISPRPITKSMFSFKVLTECPIIIALLFQLHKNFVTQNVPMFVEPIVKVLLLQPSKQFLAHQEAAKQGNVFIGMSPAIMDVVRYGEYKSLQVKTVSFLAYILRSFLPIIKPYQDQIAMGVITLMKDCPGDASATRKELLVATRHLWFTEFRSSFISYMELLFNEDILIGTGVTCRETLRNLACQVLTDLIYHVRSELSLTHLMQIIPILSNHMQDDRLTPPVQTMCCKILFSLAENIIAQPSKQEARHLLVRILDSLSGRLITLKSILPTVVSFHQRSEKQEEPIYSEIQDIESFLDVGSIQPIRSTSRPMESTPDLLKEMRMQFKTVLVGVKNILFTLRQFDSSNLIKMTTHIDFCDEGEILLTVFKEGLGCFEYLFVEGEDKALLAKDSKEITESFASIFTYVDPAMFQEVCCENMEFLFEKTVTNPSIIAIPQYFFSNATVSANFSGPLLSYLVDRFKDVGHAPVVGSVAADKDIGKSINNESTRSSVMLRLFTLLFKAVSLFPEQNEKVLQPHLAKIIMLSLKLSETAKEPLNYFLLLRNLFRSIGGGKFETLYQEVLPLLQVLLQSLNTLLSLAYKPQMRELFVELCLTVPVRLSVLLPHLSYLMKPLVIALQSGPDLVNQSLRTLELCIDNLNHEFLEPIFAPVKDDLMTALWKHLQPIPYNHIHSHTTLRILGKFGGRNRSNINDQSPLLYDLSFEDAAKFTFCFQGTAQLQEISLFKALTFAHQTLLSSRSNEYDTKQAYLFVHASTGLFLEADQQVGDLKATVEANIEQFKSKYSGPNETDENPKLYDDYFKIPPQISRTRKHSLDNCITLWFESVIAAGCVPELEQQVWWLIERICHHFALLAIEEVVEIPRPESNANIAEILATYANSNLKGFLTSLVNALANEIRQIRDLGEKIILQFHSSCKILLGDCETEKIAAFQVLTYSFSSYCYQKEWYKKAGGCLGLAVMTEKLDFSAEWMIGHQIEFTKSMLFVLKDMAANVSLFNISSAAKTLTNILRNCNKLENQKLPIFEKTFTDLVASIIPELSNANLTVRNTVKGVMELLAELTGRSVTDILTPVKHFLLNPIFAKPLRALPFALQMGYIDAITYCLTLTPSLASYTEELTRLVQEALALADAEDQSLLNKDNQYRMALSVNNLRVECIKLLSAVMELPDISSGKHGPTRNRIITLFFKCLYSKCPEVIEVANKGLTDVLNQQQRLPKDLLQAGLKPILVNMSDYKKLSVAALEGLARLLELLTNYFKVEIGRKLLDHLRQWADPQKLEEYSAHPLADVDAIAIIAGIFNVFYLLPPAANIFMDELVTQVIELETQIHRSVSSPFRKPLCRYLNRYAGEAFDYFLARFHQPLHSKLFIALLRSGNADELLNEVLNNPIKIINQCFLVVDSVDVDQNILRQHGIQLLTALADVRIDWFVQNRNLLDQAINVWRANTNGQLDKQTSLQRFQISLQVFQLLMVYCKNKADEIDLLFVLMEGFTTHETLLVSYLKQFLFEFAAESPIEKQKNVILRYLQLYAQSAFSLKQKAIILRYLIIPLAMLNKTGDIFSQDVVQSIMTCMWTTTSEPGNESDMDALKVAQLQLSTLLLYQVPNIIEGFKKEVIKFAWSNAKMEDLIAKQSAFVLLCRFIKEFEAPPKIVAQSYVAQLKAHQADGRTMVRQALDSIVPALPNRTGMNLVEGSQIPVWVQWIRKIIIEDGHSVSQLVSVFQLIIRNAKHFYTNRHHFMPQIIQSLARLGLSGNATQETRNLSVDMVLLIIEWEKTAKEELASNEGHMEVDTDEPETEMLLSQSYQEVIITFIIRFYLSLGETHNGGPLFVKSMEVLEASLTLWPNASTVMSQLEKVITSENVDLVFVVNAAEILKVLTHCKSQFWILENISMFQKCLEKWGSSDQLPLLTALSTIIEKVCDAFDHETGTASSQKVAEKQLFFKTIDAKLHEKLKVMINIDAIAVLLKSAYYKRIENQIAAQSIRVHLADLAKLLQTLVSDTYLKQLQNLADPNQPPVTDDYSNAEIVMLVLNTQMLYLGELRKQFIGTLLQILENAKLQPLHQAILKITRGWILETPNEAFPSVKEKSAIVVKMFIFKAHGNTSLFEEYMQFVAEIYEEKSLSRTEITVRLEHVFLEGLKLGNPNLRHRFASIFDQSVPHSIQVRMSYVLRIQNWQNLADSFWICQALDLLLGAVIVTPNVYDSNTSIRLPFLREKVDSNAKLLSSEQITIIEQVKEFLSSLRSQTTNALINPLRNFIHNDVNLAYSLWVDMFSLSWNALDSTERHDSVKSLISLLAKDYHIVQVNARPNVIQALLDGVCKATPSIQLPPQLLKYLGQTYNAWHTSMELLTSSVLDPQLTLSGNNKDDEKIRESFMDALCDLYSDLSEDDYFAGLWRRRCQFTETNAAVSFEQTGMWQVAQKFYESAQAKARTCVLPFTESEYLLWEKQWIKCTEKLQQWDILCDLSKHDSNPDLLLDCSWRISDWIADREPLAQTLKLVSHPPTPRKKLYHAFLVLQRLNEGQEPLQEFNKICDEGIQLVLKQWHSLPRIISYSHIPTFYAFQQFVELQEACGIQTNLHATTASNIDMKSQELKNIISTWRDRLPNMWDDMSIWSDLVAWRQHVFTSINKAYLPLIPQLNAANANGGQQANATFAFRGYHETAWIINRFANIARKHNLPDVCISSLGKIYTLPNIEIQEAFYKLREQAKLHKNVLGEYSAGLDVINQTNFTYFSNAQRAEFYTLRGIFLAKLGLHTEAMQAFSTGTQLDVNIPGGWARFGEYNDRMFDENPGELKYAYDAINCYLHAAEIYNNSRSRKYLSRIMWLISLDDNEGSLMKAYESFKTDAQVWYWITFIPELITSLSRKEVRFARTILMKLAKAYPQALHFSLRTAKEGLAANKKQHLEASHHQQQQNQQETLSQTTSVAMVGESEVKEENNSVSDVKMEPVNDKVPVHTVQQFPWDFVDEIMGILKTAFPLLALTMEQMVEHLLGRLKPTTDEDIYRLIVALLNDGVQMYVVGLPKYPDSGGPMSAGTTASLARFAENMGRNHTKYKEAFEHDFINSKPNMSQLVEKFRLWRDQLEALLDSRPKVQYLEHYSTYLAEFEYTKFDEIEVPGQYFQMKNSNKDFVRVLRFLPTIDVFRGHSGSYRRIEILASDGSKHPFIIQHPAAKQCRREERTHQFFRLLNETLNHKIATRKRSLQFNLPIVVPLALQVRLVSDDRSNITLQEIYEEHASKSGFHKDDPILLYTNRMREACLASDLTKKSKVELIALKAEINQEISEKLVPETILSKFFTERMLTYQDLWTIRKRFTTQMACVTFMTYLLCVGQRSPHRFSISCEKGNIWMPEFYSTISNLTGLFTNAEAIPFRLTPNIQHFITPIGLEGLFTAAIIALGQSLMDPDDDLRDYLSLFVREEMYMWQTEQRKPFPANNQLRDMVVQNSRIILHRAQTLSCKNERNNAFENPGPVNQTILDLINQATNPMKLAQMDLVFSPQL
ncbi:hypothetical protein BC833DRAFT_539959 [Globomyces pollinis-pini]|nr:hypothetical protein BC833DRAFT_539959 [Globomyces pollinis-pini]